MNVIDLGYDVDKLTAQQKMVVDYLTQTLALADQLDHRKIAPDISGQQGLNDAMSKQKKVLDDLTLSTDEYNKMLTAIAISQAKQNAASSDAAQTLAAEREALKQRNAEVKNTAIVNAAAQGSIEQLRAALNLLTAEYDKMGVAERNSAKGSELQQKIKGQSEALKKLEADTGRYGRNVGNYTGAISILEKSLTEVKKKIDDFTNSGNTNQDMLARLQNEENLLSQVLVKNNQGFSSLTQEVRANERALATMFEQGLQNTEAFNALSEQIAHAHRELRVFNDNQKLLSAELPGVAAMTLAAKGLAGTYAIGAGATALFADGNEKVEKELQKLVAVMTILQGLNEAHELIEKRLAVAKIFSAAGTGIQTAALKVYTFFTEGATVATKAFRAVLISTGLGAVLVLLSSFISSMAGAKEATEGQTDALRDYEQAIKDINEDLMFQNKVIDANAEKSKEQVKQRAGSEKEAAKITQQALIDEIAAKKEANDKLNALQDQLGRDKAKLLLKDDKESQEKLKDLNKREQDILKEQDKNLLGIFEDGIKLTNETEKEKTRLAEEGRKSRKASSEAGIIDLEREQIKFKKISSDEKESYSNRIKALNDFYTIQEQIENKKKNVSLSAANLTPGEVAKIIAENKKALAEIQNNRLSEQKNLADQQRQKTISIEYDLFKSSIERKKAFEQDIFSDDKRSLGERMAAYEEFQKNDKKLIDAEYKQKEEQAGLIKDNQKEVEALKKEHQDKLTIFDLKGIAERKHILESSLKAQLSQANIKTSLADNNNEIGAIKKLNDQFLRGKINAKDYADQLKAIEEAAKSSSFKSMSAALQETIDKIKAAGLDASDLELQLQNITKESLKQQGKDQEDALNLRKEKHKELMDTIVTSEQIASSSIQAIVDGQSELTLNSIQKQIDANTKQKDIEIENINASSLSQQEKAAALAIANAKAQAQEDQLNKKRRDEQIKQAQFDKDIQAFNLGIKLILDTIAAIDNPKKWLDVAADTAGLIELAAKPIPQYAEGTENHPGGPAIVGEGKYDELVKLPSGESFIADKAMMVNLPSGTTVTPFTTDEMNSVLYNSLLRKTGQLVSFYDKESKSKSNDIMSSKMDKLIKTVKESNHTTIVKNNINMGWMNHIQNQVYN